MFGDYSIGDLGAIFAMQGFAGLILFSVYVLMALGLAIIFGQMGVINMAQSPEPVQRILLSGDDIGVHRLRFARDAGRMGADPPSL